MTITANMVRHGRLGFIVFCGHLTRTEVAARVEWFKKFEATKDLILDQTKVNTILEKETALSPKDLMAIGEMYSCFKDVKLQNLLTKSMKELQKTLQLDDTTILAKKEAEDRELEKNQNVGKKKKKKKGNNNKTDSSTFNLGKKKK